VPLDGSQAAVRLHGPLPGGGGRVSAVEGVLPDASVLFVASLADPLRMELYRSPIDGSAAPVRLNDDLPDGHFVGAVAFAPGAARVAFERVSFVGSFPRFELFSALVSGGANVRVSPEPTVGMPFVDVATEWRVSSDGKHAVYRAAENPSARTNLLSAKTDGSGASEQLNATLSPNTSIAESFSMSPDGARVVWVLQNDFNSATEIYSAPIDAGEVAVQLDVAPFPSFMSSTVLFTPDSQQVVLAGRSGSAGAFYRTPIDGSAPPQWITNTGRLWNTGVSPDGETIVYKTGSTTPTELYSVPLDGSEAPALLATQNSHHDFLFTPDSSRVVHARLDGLQEADIYSVPIDGSASEVMLNAVSDGRVLSHELSADGTRVVYIAGSSSSGPRDVYSVPVAGGLRVRLNPPLVFGQQVIDFAIDPATGRVAYVADQETDEVFELYTVPLDGSGPAVKVSGALPAGFDVYLLKSPAFGSGQVVYSTGTSTVWQLHSAPVAGGALPIALTPVLTASSSDRDTELTRDGTGAVYVARQRYPDQLELFHVPLDGSAPGRPVNGPLVEGGNVAQFVVAADGEHVVYRADQEIDDVLELFSGRIERGPRRANAPTRLIVR